MFGYAVHTLLCFSLYIAWGLLMFLAVWGGHLLSSLLKYFWQLFPNYFLWGGHFLSSLLKYSWPLFPNYFLCPILFSILLGCQEWVRLFDIVPQSSVVLFFLFLPIFSFKGFIQSDLSKYKSNPIVFLLKFASNALFHLE